MSRNAASTRAIPTRKLIQQVMDDPFIPMTWGSNIPGMQAGAEVEDIIHSKAAWLRGRDRAVKTAEELLDLGLHKQIVGRVLEPWMWTIVCVSATEWSNFLELRDHPDAEPHIQMLAREIRKCLDDEDTIQTLNPGEWHLPFTDYDPKLGLSRLTQQDFIKLSVSRAASTSYKTIDGFDMTLERAAAIYNKLITSKPMHSSPAEHQAMADQRTAAPWGDTSRQMFWENPEQHGNFVGFRQYRHML